MKCFYHSDLDGYCSGAIVKLKYPDCEMFEINYGESTDKINFKVGETIFIVDFSFDNETMQNFRMNFKLIWIDHHKTSIESILNQEKIAGLRRIGTAGCELTWMYTNPDTVMPKAVYLLGRYDVWDKSVDEAWDFQLAMGLDDWNPKNRVTNWRNLFSDRNWVQDLLIQGNSINKYQTQQNTNKAKRLSYEVEFESLKFITMNWSGNSKTFDSVYDETKHDGMLMFIWDKDRWSYSLYGTKDEIDLSIIAKKYGGGGHKHTCGFLSENKLV